MDHVYHGAPFGITIRLGQVALPDQAAEVLNTSKGIMLVAKLLMRVSWHSLRFYPARSPFRSGIEGLGGLPLPRQQKAESPGDVSTAIIQPDPGMLADQMRQAAAQIADESATDAQHQHGDGGLTFSY